MTRWNNFGWVLLLPLCVACGSDDEKKKSSDTCSLTGASGCAKGQVCEAVEGGDPKCFAPITVKGKVFDALDESAIAGAHVVARDANDAAISPVAVSDENGDYALQVPATRNADGTPVAADATLRADALGYLTFPKAPRTALPIKLGTAMGSPLVIQNAATDIALIPVKDASGLGSVSGKVLTAAPGGTLVLAGGVTGIADRDGAYTVFNVAAGSVDVSGYTPGVNLESKTADVNAGKETTGVDLAEVSAATAVVSGTVQIVNASGGADTSVILVLEDTFQKNAARGEAPPGLRAGNVSGAWSIEGVPDGKYIALAAFENDGLVRDPDTSIGGTAIIHFTVSGGNETLDGFKVTGALAVISPGANDIEVVKGKPELTWEDDSSEDEYLVQVFDAYGAEIWKTQGNFDPGGSKPASVAYDGPALESGMIYQFRATSIKDGTPISSTEDLKGVFSAQ